MTSSWKMRDRRTGLFSMGGIDVRFEDHHETDVVPGRAMFTRNELLNKDDRILDDLTPAELAAENRKQY